MHDHHSHHHSHHGPHHPDLQDVALGYLIGRSAGQRPPNNSDGGGGVWILVIAAVLVGLADLGMVPALWTGAGGLMRDAPVLGLLCYLFALVAAAFPPFVAWGLIDAARGRREFERQWRAQQEGSLRKSEAMRVEAEARIAERERAELERRKTDPAWQAIYRAQAFLEECRLEREREELLAGRDDGGGPVDG